jgi:hypothetical protein
VVSMYKPTKATTMPTSKIPMFNDNVKIPL